MTKTVNRPPLSVPNVTYNDLGIKYFNYGKWPGLTEDKNYVGVDQATFSDCDNVIIDGSGVLRSRPAIKIMLNTGIKDVVDVWTFDVITAYKVLDDDSYKLIFLKDGQYSSPVAVPDKFILTFADEKIFMFALNRLAYLDITSWKYENDVVTVDWYDSASTDTANANKAIDYVYIPAAFISVDGVEQEAESMNELTTAYSNTYIYSSLATVQDNIFEGESVKIKIGDTEYNIVYSGLTKYVLVDQTYRASNDIIHTGNLRVRESAGKIVAVYWSRTPVSESAGKDIQRYNGLFYYSVDLRTFNFLGEHEYIEDYYASNSNSSIPPYISDDGNFLVIAAKTPGADTVDILALSILSTEQGGQQKFPNWTKIIYNAIPYYANHEYYMRFHDSGSGSVWYTDVPSIINDSTYYLQLKAILKYGEAINQEKVYYLERGVPSHTVDAITKLSGTKGYDSTADHIELHIDLTGDWKYDFTYDYALYLEDTENQYKFDMEVAKGKLYYQDTLIADFTLGTGVKRTSVQAANEGIAIWTDTKSISTSSTEWSSIPKITTTLRLTASKVYIDITSTQGTYTGDKIDTEASTTFLGHDDIGLIKYVSTNCYAAFVDVNKKYGLDDTGSRRIYQINQSEYKSSESSRFLTKIWSQAELRSAVDVYAINNQIPSRVYIYSYDASTCTLNQKKILDTTTLDFEVYEGETVNVLTNFELFRDDTRIPLIHSLVSPLAVGATTIVYGTGHGGENFIYTNAGASSKITVSLIVPGSLTIPEFDCQTQLENYYFAFKNKLYISATGSELVPGEFKWYFPKRNTEPFDYQITALHPISTTDVAIFFEHGIWYCSWQDSQLYYFKSRIPLGCKLGNDVITTYDGKYTIFSTERGLVSMAYQDFISSTEQALTFLSDDIFDLYKEWNDAPIKITAYEFWLIIYKVNSSTAFVYDLRNRSWWPISIKFDSNRTRNNKSANTKIYLLNNNFRLIHNFEQYTIDKDTDEYYDIENINEEQGVELDRQIDWYITSQRIHFAEYYYRGERLINYDTLHYFKKVQGMRFDTVTNTNDEVEFNIDCITYDNTLRIQQTKSMRYEVDFVGSLVKNMNYPKLQEFQFILSSIEKAIRRPLMLTNIAIKYSITGQVK